MTTLLPRSLAFLLLCAFAAQADDQQLIEVRFYHFRSANSANKFDKMMKDAILPVMKKQGIGPVGVFKVLDSKTLDENARVTITPLDSLQAKIDLREAYVADPNFWPNARDYLVQEKGDPAYERVESMLLRAFTGMPKLNVPGAGEGKQRRFELRTYKSENDIQGILKVQMFNEGEIELFKKVGLPAVFYGEALIASNLPQLTYMLVHDDEEAQKESWKKFFEHPDWKALSADEQYQVIKLQVTKHMLTATDYSPIK